MDKLVRRSFDPRKTPVQTRSTQTVEAISEATIQVLLSHGAERLTTTRVAERAGVSIGTLYQYYPNKQSLLFALLERQLDRVAAELETACNESRGKPLTEMIAHVVLRFVDAKMLRTDISTALYRISAEVDGPALVKRIEDRSRRLLEAMIESAPDATSKPHPFAIQMLYSAMSGATRSVLEAGASPAMVHNLRRHLVLLCQSYMSAVNDLPR